MTFRFFLVIFERKEAIREVRSDQNAILYADRTDHG